MTPLLPKSKPIRIMKPEDFPPRPAPPEPGPELPPQPRAPLGLAPLNVDDVLELIGHFMPDSALVAEAPNPETSPDPRDEELAALRARVAELEARDRSVFADAPLLPAPDALMSDYGPVDPKDAETIIDGFAGELRTSRDTAEGTMRSMDPPDRRRLFSILNTELGRLKNQEALLGKSIPRRADVEELIGILAKVGEA